MRNSTKLKAAAAIFSVLVADMIGAGASASPGSGITPEVLVQTDLLEDAQVNHDRIKLQTKDPTTVRVQKQTFAPASFSGWHHHPGVVVVAVKSGLVTFTDANCVSKTYGPGSPNGSVFVEGQGDDAHEARSASGATAYVALIVPGTVFRIEDPARSCP